MESQTIFVFFALILAAATSIEAMNYRPDYKYDSRTDTFYKLHVGSGTNLQKEKVCDDETAELMSPISGQELSQVHTQFPHTDEQLDTTEGQSILYFDSQVKQIFEMACQVTTRDGNFNTSSVFHNTSFFICKLRNRCNSNVKGDRFYASVASCYNVPRVMLAWHEAAAYCQAEGAHLAVISNQREINRMNNLLSDRRYVPDSNQTYFLIGFRAVITTEPRVFKTIFNETLEEAGFSSWATGEPNNGGGAEHCGSLYKKEMKLNDIPCDHNASFICEKEATCVGH